jgi:hypothetical protein
MQALRRRMAWCCEVGEEVVVRLSLLEERGLRTGIGPLASNVEEMGASQNIPASPNAKPDVYRWSTRCKITRRV